MTDRLVALCLRAAAPPPELGAPDHDPAMRAMRAAVRATRQVLDRCAAGPGPLVLALAPTVLEALDAKDLERARELESRGDLEVCITGATDAWLPALGPGGRRAQVAAAAAVHRRCLGRQPLGLWPRDLAVPLGLDGELAAAGLRWTLVPSRALELAGPPRSPATPVYWPSGVAAFGARPPAAPASSAATYDGRPPLEVITAEVADGEAALRDAAARGTLVTPAAYLRRFPRNPLAHPLPLAGPDEHAEGPYAAPDRAPWVRHLRQLEAALASAVQRTRAFAPAPGIRRRTLRQATREGLLAAAGAWSGDDAGAARFRAHVARCASLCAALTGAAPLDAIYLAALESRDGALGEDLDPELFAAAA